MVLLESLPTEIGSVLPEFSLKNTQGLFHTSKEVMGEKGLLVVFTCNHCPYAIALWKRLVRDTSKIRGLGFNLVAINPNIHPDYPEDSPEHMVTLMDDYGVNFEYLVDDNQSVAKQYDAQCTPEFYLVDPNMHLMYRGAYDDSWQDESKVTQAFVLDAMAGASSKGIPSIGCSIKWQDVN